MTDVFLKIVKDEIAARKKADALGVKLVTPAEVGIHPPAGSPHAGLRIFRKPNEAEWQRQTEATHKRLENESEAVLMLGMQGMRQGTASHREALAAWKAGKLQLPSLADVLGLKPAGPMVSTPRAETARRETNEQLESRLARQHREKIEGVRLVKPTTIGR